MPAGELTVKVGGDFNAAINDNTTYEMASATLQMVGLVGSSQSLAVVSKDVAPIVPLLGDLDSDGDVDLDDYQLLEAAMNGPSQASG